jgi:DNA gyrase subunit A
MLLTVADTHDDMFFFTDRGKVYYLKCHEIPAGSSRTSKGLAIVNLLSIVENEKVTSMTATTGLMPDAYMVMATKKGEIKKTSLDKFAVVRSSGLIAMDLESGDELVSVVMATDKDDVIMITQKGQSIRFPVSSLRAASRTSGGVRGIRLAAGDGVVSIDKVIPDAFLLVVSEGGYGKITPLEQYPRQHRAGGGVRTFKIVEKSGRVTAARVVTPKQQVMLISAEGMVTRTPVKEKDPRQGISTQGRSTQGVRVMTLDEGDRLVAITAFDEQKLKEG